MDGIFKGWYNGKDYGYIAPDDGSDVVFIHKKAVPPLQGDQMFPGMKISFTPQVASEPGRNASATEITVQAFKPRASGIYFDGGYLQEPEYNYVCWIDVMGTKNQMARSLKTAANFIFKLQAAVVEARLETDYQEESRLYPTIDGIYITTFKKRTLQLIVNQAMCRCALTFLNEITPFHRFLVRGAVAYGPVYHGVDLPPKATFTMDNNRNIRDAILIGLPMVQANIAESEAAPFGIAVHDSARAFAPVNETPFNFIWLDWFNYCTPKIDSKALLKQISEYFIWQKAHTTVTGYKPDRVDYHFKLATEFFSMELDRQEKSER